MRQAIYTLTVHLRNGHALHAGPQTSVIPDDTTTAEAAYAVLHQAMIDEFAKQTAVGAFVDLLTCGDEPGFVAVNPAEVAYFQTIIREIRDYTPQDQPVQAQPSDLLAGVDLGALVVLNSDKQEAPPPSQR